MIRRLCMVAAALLCVGCASAGKNTFSMTEPTAQEFENSQFVNEPFETVWDRLVADLSKSFFVINNIEKESRLINVSFSSSNPEEYIDCGTAFRTFERGRQKETFEYEIAGDSVYKIASKYMNNNVTTTIHRDTSLEGRINIYVAPEGNGTRVNVNTRYIFTIKVDGMAVGTNAFTGAGASQAVPGEDYTHSFGTTEPLHEPMGTEYLDCRCKGVLEGRILQMAAGQ